MRNIKAEQAELFRWCINFSQFAKAMIIITVDSIIFSNLLLVQFRRPFRTSFFSMGDSKGKHRLWPSGGIDGGWGPRLNETGHPLCSARQGESYLCPPRNLAVVMIQHNGTTDKGCPRRNETENWTESIKPLKLYVLQWKTRTLIYMHIDSGT